MTRIGASQAFFNIAAQFNAQKFLSDARSLATVMKSVQLDTFEAILKPMEDFGAAIEGAVDATKDLAIELGQASVEFEKFYGSGADMVQMRNEIIGIGLEYKNTATEALAAGSRAAQVANLIGKHNVGLLVKQANILSEISDLTVEEAQRGIIKLQQQTGILYGDYTQAQIQAMNVQQQNTVITKNAAEALDALNTIANRSVALEGDLVNTMTVFASQAHLAGDSFEYMASMSAVLLEAGEQAGTAGRALKMIYARLGGNINGTTDAIEAMGYSLHDENNEMKNMQDIIAELATNWDGLSKGKQQDIAQTIAGNRHYVRFIKLMENQERATVLAAEGAEGLDSAVDQATRALEDQSAALMILNNELDYYKAAIGQDMGSFMIGQMSMQKDYLEVVSVVMKDMGKFGQALGRLYETAKVTGEFIKMGIAIRSMSIGFGIYESVMRGTHGIEIANQALHSKQANYFDYRQTMTEDQKTLMKGIMYETQKINTATEAAGIMKKQMNAIEMDRKKNLEEIGKAENFINHVEAEQLDVAQKLAATKRLQAGQAVNQNNLMERRLHQMQYMKDVGRDTQQEWQDHIKGRGATEDAYARQLMAAYEIHGKMSGQQRGYIRDQHQRVRAEHSFFQTLKEQNDMARKMRTSEHKHLRDSVSLDMLHKDKDMMEQITAQLDKQAVLKQGSLDNTLEEVKGKQQIKYGMEQQNKLYKDQLKGITQIQKALKRKTMKVGKGGIEGEGAEFLKTYLQELQGEFIALDKSVNIFNKQLFDSGDLQHRFNELTQMADDINNPYITNLGKRKQNLEELYHTESQYMKEVVPLLEEYEAAVKAGGDASKQKAKVISALNDELEDTTDLQEMYATGEQKMTMTQEQAIQQSKRMTFAGANAISMLGGLIGKTEGATLSLTAMTLQLGSVAGEAVTAGMEMVKLNRQMMIAAKESAKKTGEAFSALAFNIKAYGKVVALAAASVAMMLYFQHMQKEAQEAQDRIRGVQEATENLNAVFDGLTASGTIFGQDEGLAELLGLDNVSMGEFANNTDLITSYLNTILEADIQITGARNEQLQTTKEQLELMQQMYEGAGVKSVGKFTDAIDKLGDAMDDAGHLGIGGFDGFSKYERKKVLGIMEELGMSMDDIRLKFFDGAFSSEHDRLLAMEAGDQMAQYKRVIADEGDVVRHMGSRQQKLLVMELVELMKTGTKISEDIMSELTKSFEGEDAMGVIAILESMNDMVLTEADVEAGIKDLEKAFDDLNDTAETTETDLANLTEELYNFANAREELFFGGKYGNVTGSLYKQVVTQGVGTLYHKNEIIVSNVFHGFFNEQEAAFKISNIVENILDGRTA